MMSGVTLHSCCVQGPEILLPFDPTSATKHARVSLKRLFPSGVALALALSRDVTETYIYNYLTTKTPILLVSFTPDVVSKLTVFIRIIMRMSYR